MKKTAIVALLEDMPEEIDVDRLIYVLALRRDIERGIAGIEARRFVTDEELDAIIDSWQE